MYVVGSSTNRSKRKMNWIKSTWSVGSSHFLGRN